jgi:uncharacterized membrane protein
LNAEKDKNVTFGQKLADKIAAYGGSWKFIITFAVFILIWVLLNTILFFTKPFDPYPFILLNLFLSCLAALQAPVIMMSQNRQEEKDRRRERGDFLINMKAELEVRNLHEKLDLMMAEQMKALFELQKKQIELMNEILNAIKEK